MSSALPKAIEAAIARTGLSQAGVARAIGVAPTSVTRWIQGKNVPGADHVAALCALAKMSSDELLGLPVRADQGFQKGADNFGTLSSALGKVGAGPAILDPKEGRGYAFHEDWLRHRPSRGKHLRMVQVDKRFGDSMVPTIYPGSMLAVDLGPGGNGYPELGPHEGKIFLVRPDPDDEHGGMVVKRVYVQDGNLVLVSDNLHTKPRLQVIPLKRRPLQRFLLGRVVHVARDEE